MHRLASHGPGLTALVLAGLLAHTFAQSSYDVPPGFINLKFLAGLNIRIQPGIANVEDADGFAVGALKFASISTVEGNTTSHTSIVQEAPEPGISGRNSGFVSASGNHFVLNGKPFFCAGTNAYYAALKYIMSSDEVYVMFKEHAMRKATLIRLFAHSNFDSVPDAMMPSFGVYNEEALKRLDVALAAAAENGVRLILVLSNFWPFLGGAQQWVDKALGPGKDLSLFYTDPTLRQYYKDWVKHVVTRKNTVTGQNYKDDPTIFAWELMNEPRVSMEGGYEQNKGLKPGKIICDWVREMAPYVKSLDSTHMVTTGEEGFRADGSTTEPHSWINNGYNGGDFTCNLGTKEIDFGTLHTYPDQWDMPPPNGYEWLAENYYKDRADVAHGMGKPILLEEYGQGKSYYGPREKILEWTHEQANKYDYAGTLTWAVAHYSTDSGSKGQLFGSNDGQGYVFAYDGDGSKAVLKQYDYMVAKEPDITVCQALGCSAAAKDRIISSNCTDTPPDSSFTCEQQVAFKKCDESWMSGYCQKSCERC